MGRRRRSGRNVEDFVLGILALFLVVVLWASDFDLGRAVSILKSLFTLLIALVVIAVLVIIAFFSIRAVNSPSRADPVFTTPYKPSLPRHDRVVLVPPEPTTFADSKPAARSVTDKLRATDWYQFEKVVGLVYESQGYHLERRGGQRPDGGIDLIVEKDGERAAVQCKRWKKWEVKEPLIRELLGAMTHEGLTKGVVVALNGFTYPAKQLAIQHNIDIVHDDNLATIITGLTPEDQLKVHAMLDDEAKYCPKCESRMVWRTPKPGKKWTPFWGCSRYPKCHGQLQED